MIQARYPQWVLAAHQYRGDETIVLKREGLLDVSRFLRDDAALAFNVLMDVSCVDYLAFGTQLSSAPTSRTPSPLPYFMRPKPTGGPSWERGVGPEYRFDVVYHFYSLTRNQRVRLRVPVAAEDATVPSLHTLWHSANWFEREVWDMFGVRFTGHPNLQRILMYEEFKGHALRKDYPIYKRQPLIGPVSQRPTQPIIVGMET